jgi:hypothetical protein
MLTVPTQFSALVLTVIILVPVRPSRENVISMPRPQESLRPPQSAGERPQIFGPCRSAF